MVSTSARRTGKDQSETTLHVPLIHPSWRPGATARRMPAERLKPDQFWERLGL